MNGSDDNKMLKQERYETSGAAQLEKFDTHTFQLLYIVRKIKCKIARKLLLKPGMAPNSRDGDATKGIRFEDLSDKIPSLGWQVTRQGVYAILHHKSKDKKAVAPNQNFINVALCKRLYEFHI